MTTMRRRVEHTAVLALVLALHLLLFAWWPRSTLPSRGAAMPEPVTLSIRLPSWRDEPPPSVATATPTALRAARSPAPAKRSTGIGAAPLTESTIAIAASAPTASTAANDDASALDLRLQLPRGSAERGGLRLAPDSMVRQALNDPRANSQPDPTQVLPRAIAESVKGDCMKDGFAGAGMGLLSLPFLAYAIAADHCKPQR